jgi:hypothetical protein
MGTKDLNRLFEETKAKDEFEFVCALINYKGTGSKLLGSNVFEWFDAIENYERRYRDKKYSLHEQGRFALLIYSTFFELSDMYLILGNLARVTMGYRCTPYLYWKHQKANRWFGAAERISLIDELFIDAGFYGLQKFFKENYFEQIRHAFFHSTYAFDNDEYILNEVETLYIDHVGHHSLSLTNFIFPKVDLVLEFFHCFKDLFSSSINSYVENKTLTANSLRITSVDILGSKSGLLGFKDSSGNGLELKNDVWTSANNHFDLPASVDKHVADELERLSKKDKILSDDGSLQHLYEVISERNVQGEREKIGGIYANLGDKLLNMSSAEQNHFRMIKLRAITQRFYDKMSELSPAHKMHVNKSLLKWISAPGNAEGVKQSKEALNELLAVLKIQVKKEVLTNVSVMLTELRRNGVEIGTEKNAFEKILKHQIPPDLTEHAAKIAEGISKL